MSMTTLNLKSEPIYCKSVGCDMAMTETSGFCWWHDNHRDRVCHTRTEYVQSPAYVGVDPKVVAERLKRAKRKFLA